MGMNVAELLAILVTMPQDADVFVDNNHLPTIVAVQGVSGPDREDDGSQTVILEAD